MVPWCLRLPCHSLWDCRHVPLCLAISHILFKNKNQAWWSMPIIPTLRQLRLEGDGMLPAIKSELTWASQWDPVLKTKSWGCSSMLKCLYGQGLGSNIKKKDYTIKWLVISFYYLYLSDVRIKVQRYSVTQLQSDSLNLNIALHGADTQDSFVMDASQQSLNGCFSWKKGWSKSGMWRSPWVLEAITYCVFSALWGLERKPERCMGKSHGNARRRNWLRSW